MGLFAAAKTLEKKPTAKAKQDKKEIPIAKIQQVAEIKALMQTLAGTLETLETEVKTAGFSQFLEMDCVGRPESFRGTDGMASASVEMRKRSTNSALNEDEVKVLREHGIEPFKQIVTQEMFGINPTYAADNSLMQRVEKALVKVAGLPADFIVKQEEVSKLVVTDEMLDAAFKKRDPVVLQITTCMALKPKLNEEYPMENLFDNVKAIVQPEVKAKKVALPGSKKAA
jgi:hypothetical protein